MVIKEITSIKFELGENETYKIILNDTVPEDGKYTIKTTFANRRHIARVLSKEAALLWLELDNILYKTIYGEPEENE